MELRAPIVAVTVHPDRARVTRRGRVTVPEGASELLVADLPEGLVDDTVRVAGSPGLRVAGVDLARRDLADVPDERVRAAEDALRAAERDLAAVDGADAGDTAREELLRRLARRAGDRLAAALAEGTVGPDRVSEIGATVAAQLVEVAAARGEHAERRAQAEHARDAARAALERLQTSGRRRREARIAVEADAAGAVDVELGYTVVGASWSAAYEAAVTEDRLSLTLYGLIAQTTGEDWPPCALTLSTARASAPGAVPELEPWWVDVRPPMMPMAAPEGARARTAVALAMAPQDMVATPVENAVAVAWQLARPVAVPGDGTPHRAAVDTATLDARLDHVTAPVLDASAHVRATAKAPRALPAGPVAASVDGVLLGSTRIEPTAPGAELELALGVDERVAVERELTERTVGRTLVGGRREAVETWTVTVHNGRSSLAHLVVRDRVPVSRNADVQIVDVSASPEPAARDDLGRVEWRVDVPAGGTFTARLRFGVRHAKDLPLVGWR